VVSAASDHNVPESVDHASEQLAQPLYRFMTLPAFDLTAANFAIVRRSLQPTTEHQKAHASAIVIRFADTGAVRHQHSTENSYALAR